MRMVCSAVLIALFLLIPGGHLAAQKIEVPGTIALFPLQHSGIQLNALSEKSAQAIIDVCDRLGRFLPVELEKSEKALEAIPQGSGDEALYKAAQQLKADLFGVISIATDGNTFTGTVAIRSVAGKYKSLQHNITVRSKVMMNIPTKLAREIALLHKNMPLSVNILETRNGCYLVNSGQWHGLSPRSYRTEQGEEITILTMNRYQSLASLSGRVFPSSQITIRMYPPYKAVVNELDKLIEYNTNSKFSLTAQGDQGKNPEKNFTTGMCIVNPGANVCLPGYGSYLSTSYMGFKETKPSVGGIVFSSLLILTHFLLPEFLTGFKINFIPGVMDSDKTTDMNNLQIFCWATVPLSVTVAFLDQLAYQFKINNALPPFFMNRNETALALSLFIPGGGMFYKGYRIPGWTFYLPELSLAGFMVYYSDDQKKLMYAGIALGGLKIIELITVYFCPPAFDFFKYEQEGAIQKTHITFRLDPAETGDLTYKIGLSANF